MGQPDGLVEWLHRQVDEDEWWAKDASRRDDGEGAPGGVHWQWECNQHDQPAGMDPALDELLRCPVDEDCFSFGLRSVEDFPTGSVGPLPVFSVPYAEEQPVAPAGHIVRHDPARVLAQVAAHRAILEQYEQARARLRDAPAWDRWLNEGAGEAVVEALEHTVRHLATMYADRDGWREEWRPE